MCYYFSIGHAPHINMAHYPTPPDQVLRVTVPPLRSMLPDIVTDTARDTLSEYLDYPHSATHDYKAYFSMSSVAHPL